MKAQLAHLLLSSLMVLNQATGDRTSAPQNPPPSAPQSTNNAQTFHIELNLLRNCSNENCPHFTASNFAISSNGRVFPVRVTFASQKSSGPRSQLPAHLLAVYSHGKRGGPRETSFAESFSRVLSQGWLVSVNRVDGSFTPYCADVDSLKASLELTHAAPMASDKVLPKVQSATTQLKRLPGHRVLLLDGGWGQSDDPAGTVASLIGAGVTVYLVDGGRRTMAYYDASWGYSRWLSPQGLDSVTRKMRFAEGGVFHEVNLAATLKDAIKHARYDLDLEFEIPGSQSEPSDPFTLTLLRSDGFIPSGTRPDLYTVTEQTVDGQQLTARVIPKQKAEFVINDCGNPQIPCPVPPPLPK